MDPDVLKLITGGGALVGALYVLGRILFRIGERMIAAIDRIAIVVETHTKADVDAQGEVRESVQRLEGKFDAVLENQVRLTPVEGIPIQRAGSQPAVAGEYSVRMRKP